MPRLTAPATWLLASTLCLIVCPSTSAEAADRKPDPICGDFGTNMPFEKAYEKATLIFYGFPQEHLWSEDPARVWFEDYSGAGMTHVTPQPPGTPFDLMNDSAIKYQTVFKVEQTWKDTEHRIADNKVTIESDKSIRFEKGQGFIVYAYNMKGVPLPRTRACMRSRPLRFGADDVRWLSDKTQTDPGARLQRQGFK